MALAYDHLELLNATIDGTPLIDNHAHPLLKPESLKKRPLLSIASEANGAALDDSKTSLAHLRAVKQLAAVLDCEETWEAVVAGVEHKRLKSRYGWIEHCLESIETILIDDGLDAPEQVETYSWHNKFTKSKCKRIVRIETVAEDILAHHFVSKRMIISDTTIGTFVELFSGEITKCIADPNVAGFKSILCYRHGLDVPAAAALIDDVRRDLEDFINAGLNPDAPVSGFSLNKRLENTGLNHLIVHVTAQLICKVDGHMKPLQFHTGLGDNDITLTKSSPSHLQTFIRDYPTVPIVLLHAGYPWTRETAYLAAMYPNVYADIGEVFPSISRGGQEEVLKEMLELCPWSKVLCSTDAHSFPEMYLITTAQIRSALKTVLGGLVHTQQLNEEQAAQLAQDILFSNSKKLYNLETESNPATLTQLKPVSRTDSSNQLILQKLQSMKAKYLRVYWQDYTASSHCRLFPIKQVYKRLSSGEPFTLSLAKASFGMTQIDALIPQVTATGMYTVHPDWSSLKSGPVDGQVSCFGYFYELDGSESALCPRAILRKAVKNAEAQGLTFLFGFEVEFVVLERNTDVDSVDKYRTMRTDGHSWSIARSLADWGREGSFSTAVDEIMDSLEAAGIEAEQIHPEAAPGQWELVLAPLPPIEACDSLLHARQILESVAARHGFRVTLHPKPFSSTCGSGSHAHMSISSPGGDRPELYESFYAGILEHFQAITAFMNSNPTSYERMVDSFWAGGRWIAWGTQNKELPLRKVEGSHWELKVMDGLANPYFALAALITAGTEGVVKKTPLSWGDCAGDPARYTEAQRKELGIEKMFPGDLREALKALQSDSFGLDPRFVQRYVDIKEGELALLEPMTPEDRRRWMLERY